MNLDHGLELWYKNTVYARMGRGRGESVLDDETNKREVAVLHKLTEPPDRLGSVCPTQLPNFFSVQDVSPGYLSVVI